MFAERALPERLIEIQQVIGARPRAPTGLRRTGVRSRSKVIWASASPGIFGVAHYGAPLRKVIARKGIETLYRHDLIAVRPASKQCLRGGSFATGGLQITSGADAQRVLLFASVPLTAEGWEPLAEGEVTVARGGLQAVGELRDSRSDAGAT